MRHKDQCATGIYLVKKQYFDGPGQPKNRGKQKQTGHRKEATKRVCWSALEPEGEVEEVEEEEEETTLSEDGGELGYKDNQCPKEKGQGCSGETQGTLTCDMGNGSFSSGDMNVDDGKSEDGGATGLEPVDRGNMGDSAGSGHQAAGGKHIPYPSVVKDPCCIPFPSHSSLSSEEYEIAVIDLFINT